MRVDIAHEMLIVGWPRSQEWVQSRREAELARRRLEEKAADWRRLGGAVGGLLDEVELLEAERWLQNPDAADLGGSVALVELVRTSRAAVDRAADPADPARTEPFIPSGSNTA